MARLNEIRAGEVAVEPPAATDAGLVFIGLIRTPWTDRLACPRQGRLDGPICRIELFDPWAEGLDGLGQYDKVEVLYWLDRSRRDLVRQSPKSDGATRGTFSLRSPVRPNPIGTAVAALVGIEGATVLVRGLDCLDGTPLIDLKPDRCAFTPPRPAAAGRFRGGRSMTTRRGFLGGSAALLASGAAAQEPAVTDAAGRRVPIPARVERVFPAGPPAAILLYTLAPDLLLGWTNEQRPAEREFLLPEIAARPAIGRITGRGNTANLETVLTLKPDLILDVGSTTDTYVSLADRVQAQTGIPYALLDGTLARTPETYRVLGRLVRREADGEALATYASSLLDRVAARVASVPPERRPRVYFARGPRGLETGRGGSINVESLDLLGAVNVAGETRGGLATVSVEQVLAWNPDAIVTIDGSFARGVRQDPAWSGLTAVRDGRVHLAPSLPFGWIDSPPAVNRLIGLLWLGKVLYPDRFPEDLAAETRAFYGRMYRVAPTDAQIARLLAPAG